MRPSIKRLERFIFRNRPTHLIMAIMCWVLGLTIVALYAVIEATSAFFKIFWHVWSHYFYWPDLTRKFFDERRKAVWEDENGQDD